MKNTAPLKKVVRTVRAKDRGGKRPYAKLILECGHYLWVRGSDAVTPPAHKRCLACQNDAKRKEKNDVQG